ncbi:hypothetical protein AGMMS49949_04180 [Alphaproteobacteria bacterium]|nr:hypothetical protein AGMMS49949_04180 [Alphaproteobacteria bacterium]GHS97132.1 hypothetical protein AGMMS50296_3870 [Alphaproteobacteria bacterium]
MKLCEKDEKGNFGMARDKGSGKVNNNIEKQKGEKKDFVRNIQNAPILKVG